MQTQLKVENVVDFICSASMKQAVLEVLSKLPADDLDLLSRRRVTVLERNLSAEMAFGAVEFHPGGPWEKDRASLYLDFRENPLPAVQQGVVAHELAHIFHFHHRDVLRWHESTTMSHQQRVEARENIERGADEQARKWGFGPELRARNQWKLSLMQAEAKRIEARRK